MGLNGTIEKIEKLYKCMNNGLMDSLNFIITNNLKLSDFIDMIKGMKCFLNYRNYTIEPLYVDGEI